MTEARRIIMIECDAIDAEELHTALGRAIEAERRTADPDAQDDDAPVSVSRRTVRGADAVTLAQIAIDVSVNVDVGKILYGVAAVLASLQARVFVGGRAKKIKTEADVAGLLEDQRITKKKAQTPSDSGTTT